MKAGKNKGSPLDDEIEATLPEGLADDPALDDLLADLNSSDTEVLEESDLVRIQSTEDVEEPDEPELSGDSSAETSEPVRMYLREMGAVSLLTREGEIDLAKRIEHGQTIANKAHSRSPLAIQAMLKLGDALEQGRVSVRDVLIMPDSIAADSSGTQEEVQLLKRIAEITKHCEKAQQFRQKLQAVSRRMQPKRHRKLRYNFARSMVRLSRIYRQIRFTAQFRQKTISLIRQAVQDCEPIERAIAKIERKLESSVLGRSAGLREELLATLRQLTQELRKQEKSWGWGVNFREEKTLLGVGQAQVRHPDSVEAVPALQVASYATLQLACLRTLDGPVKPDLLPPPKWAAADAAPRFSTPRAMNQLRAEVWGRALGLANISGFADHSTLTTKPEKFHPDLGSAVFCATN